MNKTFMERVRKSKSGTGDCDPVYNELRDSLIAIDYVVNNWPSDEYAICEIQEILERKAQQAIDKQE